MELSDFHNLHLGQTCVIAGLGPNLKLTPPEKFNYHSFGVNTIYKYAGWRPEYYAGVDERLMIEDGEAIAEQYQDIPKFTSRPDRDAWQGKNFYRFYHRPGDILMGGFHPRHKDALTKEGISYVNVMTAVLQIAWHMGFATILIIGMQHKPGELYKHFWGDDNKKDNNQTAEHWLLGYKLLVSSMRNAGVTVLNISEDTYVDEQIIPRDNWKYWRTK